MAAEGHPPEVMALSFANQLLSILHIARNHEKMEKRVHDVPKETDLAVAEGALAAMGVKIDRVTEAQRRYQSVG